MALADLGLLQGAVGADPSGPRGAEMDAFYNVRGDSHVATNYCALAVVRRWRRLLRIFQVGKSRRDRDRRSGGDYPGGCVSVRWASHIERTSARLACPHRWEKKALRQAYGKLRAIGSSGDMECSLRGVGVVLPRIQRICPGYRFPS